MSPSRWKAFGDDRLLDLRFCDLHLPYRGTEIARRVRGLHERLERRGLAFRPHVWYGEEWFTPDGIPGLAIPFYLAHPRLTQLERRMMLEAEGETLDVCRRILRHEAGHAVSNAFRLHRRKRFREIFGSTAADYPEFYQPRPYSRSFVLNLDSWYAQSHPAEDFAETFAVWLTLPASEWRRRYAGWPALRKLQCVHELMSELPGRTPPVRSRAQVEPVSRLRKTLRQHYDEKRERYATDYPSFYDRDLRRLFSDSPEHAGCPPAAVFLNGVRREVRRAVSEWTGQYQYTIDQVLGEMVDRCRELRLRVHLPPDAAKLGAVTLLTVQTMNYLHGGKHRLAL